MSNNNSTRYDIAKDEYRVIYDTLPDKNALDIWEGQRVITDEHITDIVNHVRETDDSRNLTSWTACQIRNQPKLYIIDGQHRYYAFDKLMQCQVQRKIDVHVFVVNTRDDIYEMFKLIGKQTLPEAIYFNPTDKETFIDAIRTYKDEKASRRSSCYFSLPETKDQGKNVILKLAAKLYSTKFMNKDVKQIREYVKEFDKFLLRTINKNKIKLKHIIDYEDNEKDKYVEERFKGINKKVIRMMLDYTKAMTKGNLKNKLQEILGQITEYDMCMGFLAYNIFSSTEVQNLFYRFTMQHDENLSTLLKNGKQEKKLVDLIDQ